MAKKPVVLMIMDGWGIGKGDAGDAIAFAAPANFTRLAAAYPSTTLSASGEEVGLPAGQMGNSEVGHLNIGAGRIVYQDLTRINRAVADGSFFRHPMLLEALAAAKARGAALHMVGLLSDGGVHSCEAHIWALLRLAAEKGPERVFLHACLDGRDVPPESADANIAAFEEKCREYGKGRIATISGRYYGMDRDKRWDREERFYRAMTNGEGARFSSARAALAASYAEGVTDEFVVPAVMTDDAGEPVGLVREGDLIICFNFRADRMRQFCHLWLDADFSGFERGPQHPQVELLCMTQYDETLPAPVIFPPEELENTLADVLAAAGMKQLRLAETEKYAHVTFFFNGGVEREVAGESRILIPSPKVATYDLKPSMSAREVTEALLAAIRAAEHDVLIVNYANADMVGHTGVFAAAVEAVQTVDECLGRVAEAVLAAGGTLLLTADHGNADEMLAVDGSPQTAHSTNPVPFLLISDAWQQAKLRSGRLADIAPTLLALLGLPKPAEMSGESLILADSL